MSIEGSRELTPASRMDRVGKVLLVTGAVDFLLFMASLAMGWGYFSTFSLFALLAGYRLRQADYKTARLTAQFAAFFGTLTLGFLLLFMFFVPSPTLSFFYHDKPMQTLVMLALAVLLPGLLGWVYYQLTRPEMLGEFREREPDFERWAKNPRTGFIAGLLVLAVMSVSFVIMARQGQ